MSGTSEDRSVPEVHCANCGAENPRDATVCQSCGAGLSAAAQGRKRVPLVRRLLWSALVALLVLLISVCVAFSQYQRSAIDAPQMGTLKEIGRLQAAIEAYREETGALARTLREVAIWSQADESWNLRVDDTGAPIDMWRRPLQYSTDGTTYRITSYGYDGRPGGIGLYYDLSNEDLGPDDSSEGGTRYPPVPEAARATFGQFLTDTHLARSRMGSLHGSGMMMVLTCVLAALAAFVLAFLHLGERWPARGLSRTPVIGLSAIVIAALYVAYIISMVHVPSGH